MTSSRARSRARIAGWSAAAAAVIVVVGVALALANSSGKARQGGAGPAPTRIAAPIPTTTTNPARAPAMPAGGAYFGAFGQPAAFTQQSAVAAVDSLQSQVGRRLDIVHSYLKWRAPFPTASQRAFISGGSRLLLSWAGTDTLAVASGADDSWIRQRALAIKATHKPIFLEWRWEMNRPNLRAQVHSPADYIAAWDHIRSIFAQEHVENVAWVWCPTAIGFTGAGGQPSAAAFYPGNSEVDWVCSDAYPRAGPYTSFADVVQPFLAWASHIAKPIMIGEYGVPRSYGAQPRAQWLRGAAQTVRDDPQIKALVYFDGDPIGNGPQTDYGLDNGSAPMLAFRRVAGERYFNPSGLPVSTSR